MAREAHRLFTRPSPAGHKDGSGSKRLPCAIPGDRVELVNTGTTPVDVSGWLVKDNDDTHIFTIPATMTINPGAFLALDVETAYGLGAADSARLFLPDGLTLVDFYTWTTHAPTTYGRCPDGTGDDTCGGRTETLDIDATGRFAVTDRFERPGSMPNLNNEGFTITPQSECVSGHKPVFWSDDSGTDGHVLRGGTLNCTAVDLDADDDGIGDDVDVTFPPGTPEANNPGSQTFSDKLLGGSTSGKVVARNGRTLAISDAHDPPADGSGRHPGERSSRDGLWRDHDPERLRAHERRRPHHRHRRQRPDHRAGQRRPRQRQRRQRQCRRPV
ncbi:lamin tail domain-containing protein [Streptosporangiaceae bacterium NEAU-GS5]|nr:lamin tail domain-containing protein [Streptosporangiaceae bacterium NEAU-GS5]